MTKIEKLRKQQEANKKKLEKASDKRWLNWFNSCLKFIKKRIKQAVKNGKGDVNIECNDLYHVVPRGISDEFNFNYLAKRILEKLHEEGFYSFYYPGGGWVTSYIRVNWAQVDAYKKFEKECIYLISLKWKDSFEMRHYLTLFDLVRKIEKRDEKEDKIFKQAVDSNMNPKDYVRLRFSYLFDE